jgi:hypothetical protein
VVVASGGVVVIAALSASHAAVVAFAPLVGALVLLVRSMLRNY